MMTSYNDYPEIIKTLADAGADLNIQMNVRI